MKQLSRVVWNEGMHLAQHHFQAQSRYFEDAIQFALSSVFFAPYGLAGCELDGEAMLDDTTGRDERPVSVGRKNFRLTLDTEALEELVSLPIARVRRDGAGHFMYDPEYVPPCVQVGASKRLMQLLQRLIEILDAKSE